MSSQNTGIKHQLKNCHGFPTDQILLLWNKVYFKRLRPGQTINVGRPNLFGEPTFYRLATVFDDHSTCWMMLEHVWMQHQTFDPTSSNISFVLMLDAWNFVRLAGLNNMLHARTRIRTANSAVTIDTVCSRQCSLKCQRARKQRSISIKLLAKKHQNKNRYIAVKSSNFIFMIWW